MPDAIPPVDVKVKVDSKDLDRAGAGAKNLGATVKEHMTASTTHTLRFKESLTTLAEHIGAMPPIVGQTARSLESMTSNAAGMGPMGIAAVGAAAGLGLLAEGAHMAQEAYATAVKNTEDYMRVTGQSAEASSRQVEAFGELGVGADVATAAMVKLEKLIAQQPAHLAALGVEIAKDAHGNVDMGVTLGNVADAYNHASDASAKMNIVLTAFGKSGAAMIPILEQGSAKLKEMEAAAKVVLTDADVAQARKYAIQQKEIGDQFEAIKVSLWSYVQGPLSQLQDEYMREVFVSGKVDEANKALGRGHELTGQKLNDYIAKLRAEFDANQKGTEIRNVATQALKDQADAAAAATAAFDAFVGAEEAATHSDIALQRANIKVAESQGVVDKAGENLNATIAKFGPNSDEATLAAHQLTTAQLDQEAAYYDAAAAAKKLQEDTDVAATGQKDATTDAQVYIDKLSAEAATLAPGSPLRANLEAYIAKLRDEVPRMVMTTVQLDAVAATAALNAFRRSELNGVGVEARAGGGPVTAGRPYLVNEGTPRSEIFVPKQSGAIVPAGSAGSAGGLGSDGGGVTWTGDLVVMGSVQTERGLALAIREGIRRLDREQR